MTLIPSARRPSLLGALILFALVLGVIAQDAKPLARVALLSDPHVNRDTNGMNATFKGHFEKTIAAVNEAKVDFVLITGDLTQGGKAEEMADFREHLRKLKSPVWYVPGNHDVGHKFNSGKAAGTTTPERLEIYEKTLGPSFFVRKRSGVRVIGLNSPLLGSGFKREQKMWNLLEKQLANPGRTPTILFMHYPLFVATPDEKGGVYWNIEPEPRMRLFKLMKQAEVKIFLSGHLHRQLENHYNGMILFATAPISFGLPHGKQPEGWTLVTISKEGDATMEFKSIAP
jgi:3',5'-cyclic AMP phosphodiesterase CpdA